MLSQVLVDYIIFVRPFAAFIARYSCGHEAMHEYLYRIFTCEGEPLTTEDFSSALSLMTSPLPSDGGLGIALTISSWRQLSTAIWYSDSFFPRVSHLIAGSELNLVSDLQAGHSSNVADRHYGRFTSRLPHIGVRLMSMFVEVSNQYIFYFRLEKEVEPVIDAVKVSSPVTLTDSDRVTPGSHSWWTLSADSRNTDAFLSRLISSLTPVIVSSARESAAESAAVLKNELSTSGNAAFVADLSHDIQVPFPLLGTLWAFLGDYEARFRSPEQSWAVQYALERRGNLLVVLPTGAGKSLTFLLPMAHDKLTSCRGVNILVVPYNVMKDDMCRRCIESGLSAAAFHSDMGVDVASNLDCLICVADAVVNPRFHALLRTLQALHLLTRIYVDEVHHVLCSKVFRPVFSLLYRLRSYKVPIIMLSATMPPAYVQELMSSLSISQLKVIRTPSWRPDLYMTLTHLPDEEDPTGRFVAWVLYYQECYPDGKILIFCQTKSQVDDVSNLLPHSSRCHSDMSRIEQSSSMSSFISDDDPCMVMVATSMLGNGIDISNLPVVLHFGAPYSMTNYMQESGRASRDGSCGVSHVFLLGLENDSPCMYDGANVGVDAIRAWISTEQPCRRSLPHQVMDGQAITCASLPSAIFCDICQLAKKNMFKPLFDSEELEDVESNDSSAVDVADTNAVENDMLVGAESNDETPSYCHAQVPDFEEIGSYIVPAPAQMSVLVDCHMHSLHVTANDVDRDKLKTILQVLKVDKLCIICWAKGNRTTEHLPAFTCVHPRFFSHDSGFLAFRLKLRIPHGSCYFCGNPQARLSILVSICF
jgi:superfamily II DNA or RNA helicase